MNKEFRGFAPKLLLGMIELDNVPIKDYTFFILGKTGPTGKSWLTKELNSRGYSTFELSEDICKFVKYNDDENHCVINKFNKQVIIILNEPLSKVRR